MFKGIVIGLVLGSLLTVATGVFVSRLGWGYALVPVGTYASFKASEAILNKINERNVQKKNSLKSKSTMRAGKRLSTSAISAGTIGTIAVVGATTIFLIEDHCEQIAEIHETEAILNGENEMFDYNSCLKDSRELVKDWGDEAKAYTIENWKTIIEWSRFNRDEAKKLLGWPWFDYIK